MHTGKDVKGMPFQRMFTGRCAEQRICLNGGVLYNGQCVCPEYFTGENCTTPVCVNGGYLDTTTQKTCICLTGYGGPACQYQECINPANKTFPSTGKTFILVLEKTLQNQAALVSFQQNIGPTVLSLGSYWFTTWVIVTFDSTGVLQTYTAANQLDFEANLNASIASITDPGNCSLPIFSALWAATKANVTIAQGSLQYLITSGAPSDADIITGYTNYFGALSNYQLKLYYILTKTAGNSSCQSDPNNKYVNSLVDYAYGSDGDFILLNQGDVGAHASTYLSTLANSTVVGNPTFNFARNFTCVNLVYYFEVDRHSTQIYLSTRIPSLSPKPTLIDASGNPLSVDEMYHDADSHFLYKATPTGEGIYSVALNDNNGVCLLQIRLQGGLRYTPGYIVAPPQQPNITWQLDNATNVPMGEYNALVINTDNDEVRLTYAEIYNPWAKVRTLVNFYRRSPFTCSYQWVSDVFACQSRYLLIHIYGFDVHAGTFRRPSYTFCGNYIAPNITTAGPQTTTQAIITGTGTTPTQPPQTVGTTQPPLTLGTGTTPTQPPQSTTTTTKYYPLSVDIIFLLDISTAVTLQQYNDMTNFFLTALGTFNIATGPNNPNGTRFAIVRVPGNDWHYPLLAATFNSITSYNQLAVDFANAYYDASVDPPQATGQDLLAAATALIISQSVLGNGYRPYVNNHLAFYVTTNSIPSAAAVNAAANIRTAGNYSFMALGYQANGANTAGLTSYVGGANCVLTATDSASLTAQATQLADKILAASGNGGNYGC